MLPSFWKHYLHSLEGFHHKKTNQNPEQPNNKKLFSFFQFSEDLCFESLELWSSMCENLLRNTKILNTDNTDMYVQFDSGILHHPFNVSVEYNS